MRTVTRGRAVAVLGGLWGFAALWAVPAHAQGTTAGQMATWCAPYRHALRLAPRGNGAAVVEAPGANAQSDFCWGSFALLQELITLRQARAIEFAVLGPQPRGICPPITAGRLQLVQAFLTYMGAHPDQRNADFGVALLEAETQAFPCAPGG